MPEQKNKTRRRKQERWFMRTDDGAVYGPATMDTLKEWCLDGRIEPDNELSPDQKNWVPAQSVPELEMDWYARLDDGTRIGPFPLALVPGLLENGIFPGTAILQHRATGETRLAAGDPGHVGTPDPDRAPLPEPADEGADVRRLREELDAAQDACRQGEQQVFELRERLAAAEAENDHLKIQLEQIKEQCIRLRLEHQGQLKAPPARKRRSPVMTAGLLLLILLPWALLLATLLTGTKGCRRQSVPDAAMTAGSDDRTALLPAEDSPSSGLAAAGALDLQPDTTLLPAEPPPVPAESEPVDGAWPAITLPRASITQTDRAMRIVFSNGLFSAATRLSPEAEADLMSLSDQVRGRLNGHQLMIEGHTDATPVLSGGSRYVDNFALGMARAEAVKEFLVSTGTLPAEAMRTVSSGEFAPPFPNDTEEGRMKNRTVILTLVTR
jgi:flagellar motor protein MotB